MCWRLCLRRGWAGLGMYVRSVRCVDGSLGMCVGDGGEVGLGYLMGGGIWFTMQDHARIMKPIPSPRSSFQPTSLLPLSRKFLSRT